jgi:hypothetical protein
MRWPAGTAAWRLLLARAAGLLDHIAEEFRNPIASDIFADVESNAHYVDPNA